MLALWLYLAFGQLPQAASAIGAASASALAVLVWAGFRFLRDPLRTRPSATIALVAATLILQALNVPPAVVLLASAVIGSVVFRETRSSDLAPRSVTSSLHLAIATLSFAALISGRVPSFAIVGIAASVGAIAS